MIQEPLPGMSRAELGGESIFHLFPEGEFIAACCGLPFREFTADDMATASMETFNCWTLGESCD
jgi:hypothetical protein